MVWQYHTLKATNALVCANTLSPDTETLGNGVMTTASEANARWSASEARRLRAQAQSLSLFVLSERCLKVTIGMIHEVRYFYVKSPASS